MVVWLYSPRVILVCTYQIICISMLKFSFPPRLCNCKFELPQNADTFLLRLILSYISITEFLRKTYSSINGRGLVLSVAGTFSEMP